MGGGRREDQTLVRIVNLLLALAVLAESAAVRAFPVRWLVLTLLAHGEAVARSFVAEEVGDDWPGLDDGFDLRCEALDGLHLACRFRWLAAVLATVAGLESLAESLASRALSLNAHPARPALPSHLSLVIVAGPVRPRLDTS